MIQFKNVLREYTAWLNSFRLINLIQPYHLIILFGGVGVLFLYDLLALFRKYFSLLYT